MQFKTTLSISALALLATKIAAYGANIQYFAEANCQGVSTESCLFGLNGVQCCTWNSYVGSIRYSGNGGGRSVAFYSGNDVCTFDGNTPGAKLEGIVLEQSEGCVNIGNSLGLVTDTCNGCASTPGNGGGDAPEKRAMGFTA